MKHSLWESEERFRILVEGVKDYAIFMLDPDGIIISWNTGAEAIKGYRADEIIGHHFSRFYPEEAIERKWPQHELEIARQEGRFEDEGWRLRKDGTTFWANVVITALFDPDGDLRGFAKVTRDLTERRRIQVLEEADVQRNEFLAMLAHELRNPLAPIRNAVSVLQTSRSSEPVVEWAATIIERQVTHVTRLVDDLLDMSRITSKKIKLQTQPLELAQVIAGAVEAGRPLIEERRHHLTVQVPAEPLWVEGDPTRLSQVLLNLLNNAAKYTPEGGQIFLEAERNEDGSEVVIRVRDTGIGISADLLPRIFDLFVQGDRSLDRSEGGLGLGLTLVKRLLAMHGGSVQAQSEGHGRGSQFTIRLPLLENPGAHEMPQTKDLGAGQSNPRRVLIVDDNRDATETLEMLLQLWGYDVRSVHSGTEALEVAPEYQPEVVLLDIGLPGMSGYEVAQRLREIPGLAGTTLVAVTGYGQESDRSRTREAGFDRHLVKPVDPSHLQEILATAPASPRVSRTR